ncbi:alpha-galactosidase [Exiguobacterium sp. N4-1P]|uniref:alpha-galactosidase n=1 Tax=Exiguobacterium sp. N4-1P TaxID=2051906 RepID=UPI000B595DE1|nr:alpha-galactosidase [Exiguobacterium sp. N4-1P]ASI35607.1 alpha-galactosidase [Exiguobacterium sp. N4-1P]
MAIYYNSSPTPQFHIQGKDFSYILHVLPNGQLGHLYYGRKIRHQKNFSHLMRQVPRATLSCVTEGDLAFSLETTQQEFPSYGTTDYREPAFQVVHETGHRISELIYVSHDLFKGKSKLDGLPATYVEDETEATTLKITLRDEQSGLETILSYSVFEQTNALSRQVKYCNTGQGRLELTRALSMSVDLDDANYELLQLSGAWARERHLEQHHLRPGIQSISSTRGTSSSQHNPFLALKRPGTTEHSGEVFGFSLIYSGNFLGQIEVDHFNTTRVQLGIHPFDFKWILDATEQFETPEVILVYSNQGINEMSETYHRLYRTRLARGVWRDRERPTLINNWEATYFDFDEDKIVTIAQTAQKLGVELFVLDDGWFGQREDDTTSLGDWYINEKKLPNGMPHLVNRIRQTGLSFGLWFEPEMVSKKSRLFQEHPDWIIEVPGYHHSHGRHQYVLDFSREEVVDHLFEQMTTILGSADISYVKWDMNRYMTEIGSATLPYERQQEVAHRYILGVYALYERLIEAFPAILFESCASGGARFDPGMLYYAPQAWASDDTDAVERLKIQYGTSIVYPLSSIGAHVSAVPNHQVHRHTSLATRANVAFFGTFGYELDITRQSFEEQEEIKQQIHFFKKHRKLLHTGIFKRLVSPFDGDGNETAWSVISGNKEEALIAHYQVLARPNPRLKRLKLSGLDPEKNYRVNGNVYSGDELMYIGLSLPEPYTGADLQQKSQQGDFSSILYHLVAVRIEQNYLEKTSFTKVVN